MTSMARFEPLRLSELPDGVWRSRVPVRFGACDPAGRFLIGTTRWSMRASAYLYNMTDVYPAFSLEA